MIKDAKKLSSVMYTKMNGIIISDLIIWRYWH